MAAPTYRGVSAAHISGSTSATFTEPASSADGDLQFIIMESTDGTSSVGTPSTPAGWHKLFEQSYNSGSSSEPAVLTGTIFVRIRSGGGGDQVVDGVGNHISGRMLGIQTGTHGVTDVTTQIVVGSPTDHGVGTSSLTTSGITVTADSMILWVMFLSDDASDTTNASGQTNANLASITERWDNTIAQGAGGGNSVATATCAGTSTGDGTWAHDTAAASFSLYIGVPPVSVVNGTANPATVAAVTAQPSVTAAGGGTTSQPTVAGVAAQSAVTASGTAIASPSTVAAVAAQPVVTASGESIVSLEVIAVIATIPQVDAHGPGATIGGAGVENVADSTDSDTYGTTSVDVVSGRVYILWVHSSHGSDATVPTDVTNFSYTGSAIWYQLATIQRTGGFWRSTAYLMVADATDTISSIQAQFSDTQTAIFMQIAEFTNVEISNPESAPGAGTPVIQAVTDQGSGTTGSVTLASPATADNRAAVGFLHNADEGTSPEAGGNWVELGDTTGLSPGTNRAAQMEWRSDAFDTSATATWATSTGWTGIAIELRAAPLGDDATASPSVVAVLSAVPSVITSGEGMISLATVAVLSAITGTGQGGGTASPATVAVICSVGTVTATGTSTASPATVAVVAAVNAVVASGDARAPPVTVAAIAAVGIVTASGGTTGSPDTVGVIGAVGTVTATGTANTTPATAAVVASVGTVTATGSAVASPATVPVDSTIGGIASGASEGTASPIPVEVIATIPAVTASGTATASPAVVAAIATVGVVTSSGTATGSPGTVEAIASVGTVIATGAAVVTLSVVPIVSTIGGVASGTAGATASPATVSVVGAIGVVVATGTATAFPETVAVIVIVGGIASVISPSTVIPIFLPGAWDPYIIIEGSFDPEMDINGSWDAVVSIAGTYDLVVYLPGAFDLIARIS